MKRFLPLLLAMALLSGCGGGPAPAEVKASPEEVPASSETASIPPLTELAELSTPAAVTEGRAPAGSYTLPEELAGGPILEDSFPVLLAELPEEDARIYGLAWDMLLIQWGDREAEFDWPWLAPLQVLPRLFCLDLDGDEEKELIVICHPGTGTGVSVDDLYVLEKGADGSLTGYTIPWEFFREDLSAALSVETVNGRTYAILGRELSDITGLLPEEGDPANIEGLCAGDIISFSVTPEPQFYREYIRFQGSVWLAGDGYIPALAYAAGVDAVVLYQDGVFTLAQPHLS